MENNPMENINITKVPSNIQAEQGVLGSVLIDPNAYYDVAKIISSDEFYIVRHKEIFRAIERIKKAQGLVDILTVSSELEKSNKDVGGQSYLIELLNETPSSAHADKYAAIVHDAFVRRQMISKASELAKFAYDLESPVDEKLPAFYSEIIDLVKVPNGATQISDQVSKLYDDIMARTAHPTDIWGIPTGFPTLDTATGGGQLGTTFVLSGRPGLGKSIMAMQMGFYMAAHGHPGVIYSLEMSALMTLRRQLSATSKVSARAMKTGRMDEKQIYSVTQGIESMEPLPVYLSESTRWNTVQLRADMTTLKHSAKIEWFIIDYLQLLTDKYVSGKEFERIGYLSTELHSIAKDLGVFGLIVSSMTKEGMNGTTSLTSLYGGSELQHGADFVLLLEPEKDTRGNQLMYVTDKGQNWPRILGRIEKDREGTSGINAINFAKKSTLPEFVEITNR